MIKPIFLILFICLNVQCDIKAQKSFFSKGDTLYYAKVETNHLKKYATNCHDVIKVIPKSKYTEYIDTTFWEIRRNMTMFVIDDDTEPFYHYTIDTIRFKYKTPACENCISHNSMANRTDYDWFTILQKECDTIYDINKIVKTEDSIFQIDDVGDVSRLYFIYKLELEDCCFLKGSYSFISPYFLHNEPLRIRNREYIKNGLERSPYFKPTINHKNIYYINSLDTNCRFFFGTTKNHNFYRADDGFIDKLYNPKERNDTIFDVRDDYKSKNIGFGYSYPYTYRRYKKDTVCTILGQKRNCYVFEIITMTFNHLTTIRQIEVVDKIELITLIKYKYCYKGSFKEYESFKYFVPKSKPQATAIEFLYKIVKKE